MKRLFAVLLLGLLVVGIMAIPALAAPAGKDSPANDNPNNLYLYPKDSAWEIIWDGAWGKLNFKLSGTGVDTTLDGVFNGHRLVSGVDYTLIYYPEPAPWPAPVVIIGSDTADAAGNVHIAGTAVIGGPDSGSGDKIWLVLSSDINASSQLAGWNPSQYLFEHNLINQP